MYDAALQHALGVALEDFLIALLIIYARSTSPEPAISFLNLTANVDSNAEGLIFEKTGALVLLQPAYAAVIERLSQSPDRMLAWMRTHAPGPAGAPPAESRLLFELASRTAPTASELANNPVAREIYLGEKFSL